MDPIEEQVALVIAALEDGLWLWGFHDRDGYQVGYCYRDSGFFGMYRHYQDAAPQLTPITLELLRERFRRDLSRATWSSAKSEMLLLVEQARKHLAASRDET